MDSAGEQIKSAERQMLEQYQANIKAVLPSNSKTVFLSILGSFIFSAVVTIALILGAFSEKGKSDMIQDVIENVKSHKSSEYMPIDSISLMKN